MRLYIPIISLLFILVFSLLFLCGCVTEQSNPSAISQNVNPIQTTINIHTSTLSLEERNINTLKQIVEDYHKTHTYIGTDVYVCGDMSSDVWDMVVTKNINARIVVGKVDEDITSIQEANHAWVIAEVSQGKWIAMETTGGYLVCDNPDFCSVNNPRYYIGVQFNNPKELRDALDKLRHPCSDGYVLGSDQLCHPACGSGYCKNNSYCINGECRSCQEGYIFGNDLKCHQPCGSATTYCTGDSICLNNKCVSCQDGYILGSDGKCHQPCGSTYSYCPDGSVCVNGRCLSY